MLMLAHLNTNEWGFNIKGTKLLMQSSCASNGLFMRYCHLKPKTWTTAGGLRRSREHQELNRKKRGCIKA